ncbi:MAG TPA: alpha/beta hydrolase-fold protein [Anaerolineales bacterium]|nr:alpha/beta hydrolase-fold protein [Anaerolineales bacterium]
MRRFLGLIPIAAILGGCLSAPAPTAGTTSTPRPTATTTASPAPTVVPSATPRACLGEPGTFVVDEYLDDDLPRSIPYRVYLPPCYDETVDGSLPILVMLHGLLKTDQEWQDLGIGVQADRLIASGDAPPFLIVLPWQRRGLEFESALVDHLLPYVEKTYHGAGTRDRRAIGGLSRGGGWALRIGMKHADVFGSIGLHSPAVLSPDMYYVADWIKAMSSDSPRLWIDIGDHDSLRMSVFELRDLLDEAGYVYTWSLDPGDHTPEYWSGNLEAYLRWYTEPWGRRTLPETQTAPGAGSELRGAG